MESNIAEKPERGIGQRGPDKEPREFNLKSLSNLKQFQKPVSEPDLRVNSGVNWSKLGVIAIGIALISILIWKLHKRRNASE